MKDDNILALKMSRDARRPNRREATIARLKGLEARLERIETANNPTAQTAKLRREIESLPHVTPSPS